MDAALLTAIVSLIVGASGAIFAEQQRAELEQKLRELSFDVQSEFLRQKVQQRFEAYVQVFELLGTVPDVDYSGQIHEELKTNRDKLTRVADQLYHHLYSEAGLLMDMDVRNQLLTVCTRCYQFKDDNARFVDVIYDFFEARRLLRKDLELEDLSTIETELKKLRDKLELTRH